MDWLSPENVVAVVAALLGLVAPAAGAVYQLRTRRGKHIGHRVQMDTSIGGNAGDTQAQPDAPLGLFTDQPGMSNPTLALVRIENTGTSSISDADYTNPDKNHGLTVVFAERTVRSVEVIPDPKAEHLLGHFVPVEGKGGMQYNGNTIRLPRVPLNEDQHFKLLVLLSGGHAGDKIDVTGGIQDGKVERTRSMSVDDKPPLFSKPALGTTIVLAVCLLTLAGIIVFRQPAPPIGCATGRLKVVGSTAFAPAMKELASRYVAECPGSEITVDAHGSNEGVRELAEAGGADNGSPALLALSDGPKPASFTQLREDRVAIAAFALVVNDKVNVKNLTVDEIRRIYQGDVVDWKDLGGPDLPIRLVSRDANSGTRDLLRRRILDGQGEPAFTSRDCENKNSPQDKVIRCELGSTGEVLKTVARLEGAVGYSELGAAATTKGLHTLNIDGHAPSIKAIGDDTYRFTEIEYAYTDGAPASDSLTSSFLNYMIRGNGQEVLKAFGHLPCFTPDGLKRCQS
ncbi:PstS family phosphate ABC transporter substrate-binding protein [Planotetraspora kaengkrachanensis]|uniref:Phosphate-binding protein n=1 Tax=Planotetraspora kaengkrachanensis TaxID=575193 RepID=A0A8J3V9W3_9ACTN|nr:substrate-binding domain-containing protein [Planotetraspora kaengkrachanensis]GIG82977.1 phosphate-binding protein [Planotetraspora kaengkrachanensis]